MNLCDHREVIGVSTPEFRRMGAFAEYVTVPARIAYSLPDNMPFAHAALIEAVSVAVHAVSLTPVALDDTVVVVGAGMIGLLTLQAALLAGAGRVFVIDLDDTRLELARNLGATGTFNSNNGDPISEIRNSHVGPGSGYCAGVRRNLVDGEACHRCRAQRRPRSRWLEMLRPEWK